MLASFIITFHTERLDNLKQTLKFLVRDHNDVVKKSQLVTVCQNILTEEQRKEIRDYLNCFELSNHFDLNVKCMQLPILTNFGIKQSLSEKLIILESDRILPAGYFKETINQLSAGKSISCFKMIKFTNPMTDQDIDNKVMDYASNEFRSKSNEIGRRNMWSGNTALWKDDFYKAGQMDEEYIGYGWADSDMTYRMEKVGVKSIYDEETIELHLWHPPFTYGEGDQKQLFINNGIRFCKIWNKPIPDWFRKEIEDHNGSIM